MPEFRREPRVATVWVDARRVEGHHHVKVYTGFQYGQSEVPTYETRVDHRNDAGEAGVLVMLAEQWPSFIKTLAVGGHATGLRVCWSDHTDDRRDLWNGAPDRPCLLGSSEPVEWERS